MEHIFSFKKKIVKDSVYINIFVAWNFDALKSIYHLENIQKTLINREYCENKIQKHTIIIHRT